MSTLREPQDGGQSRTTGLVDNPIFIQSNIYAVKQASPCLTYDFMNRQDVCSTILGVQKLAFAGISKLMHSSLGLQKIKTHKSNLGWLANILPIIAL